MHLILFESVRTKNGVFRRTVRVLCADREWGGDAGFCRTHGTSSSDSVPGRGCARAIHENADNTRQPHGVDFAFWRRSVFVCTFEFANARFCDFVQIVGGHVFLQDACSAAGVSSCLKITICNVNLPHEFFQLFNHKTRESRS